jgi:hypothetical protein
MTLAVLLCLLAMWPQLVLMLETVAAATEQLCWSCVPCLDHGAGPWVAHTSALQKMQWLGHNGFPFCLLTYTLALSAERRSRYVHVAGASSASHV